MQHILKASKDAEGGKPGAFAYTGHTCQSAKVWKPTGLQMEELSDLHKSLQFAWLEAAGLVLTR